MAPTEPDTGYAPWMARESDDTTQQLARARDGSMTSREWLARHLYPFVLAHARSCLRKRGGASEKPESVADFAMVKLLWTLDQLRPRDGRLGPVVRAFLRNTVVQHVANTERSAARDKLVFTGGHEGDIAERQAADWTGVTTRARQSERSTAVLAALDGMPLSDREILISRFWEQEEWAVIGERTGLPLATLRKRGERALDLLRSLLPPGLEEEFLSVG